MRLQVLVRVSVEQLHMHIRDTTCTVVHTENYSERTSIDTYSESSRTGSHTQLA